MRVCHINLAKGFSGGEQQTLNLIQELAARGLDQVLVCREGGELERRAQDMALPCHPISHFIRGHSRNLRADLLHGHCGKSIYWAALEHRLRGTPYLVTRRVDNPLDRGLLTRGAYRGAARVVCLSRAIEAAVQASVGPVPTEIIPSSFSGFQADPAVVAALRQTWSGKCLVGQVGGLLIHKGHDTTFAAAEMLAESHPELHFLLLGDGPRREELEARAAKLPNVTLLGHRKDIGNYLAILDLFIFPSLSEGLGSSILEAMHAGVPVIASEAGGIPDLIDSGSSGLLVPPGNGPALAQAIRTLRDDPEFGQRLADEASRRLARFSPSAVADRYQALYAQCTAPC